MWRGIHHKHPPSPQSRQPFCIRKTVISILWFRYFLFNAVKCEWESRYDFRMMQQRSASKDAQHTPRLIHQHTCTRVWHPAPHEHDTPIKNFRAAEATQINSMILIVENLFRKVFFLLLLLLFLFWGGCVVWPQSVRYRLPFVCALFYFYNTSTL